MHVGSGHLLVLEPDFQLCPEFGLPEWNLKVISLEALCRPTYSDLYALGVDS